jgi:hypothetical protein
MGTDSQIASRTHRILGAARPGTFRRSGDAAQGPAPSSWRMAEGAGIGQPRPDR